MKLFNRIYIAVMSFILVALIIFVVRGVIIDNRERKQETTQQINIQPIENSNVKDANSSENIQYTITGETLGELGKEIILNKNTDMPTTKYLYKLPEGSYKVTTNTTGLGNFYIVKDEITTEDTAYPEILNYVGSAYMLTNGNNTFNGKAKKEVTITLKDDESIQIVGNDTYYFKK